MCMIILLLMEQLNVVGNNQGEKLIQRENKKNNKTKRIVCTGKGEPIEKMKKKLQGCT